MVERICGITPEQFHAVAELLIANSGRERTTALCYAVGWTQHTAGVQMIRAGAILQLLLGNVGRPGGGVMALRGHATIQGSTDIPTLYDLLPGYLHMPHAREGELTLADYVDTGGSDTGWWSNFDKYIVSLLKAWFGDAATEENDYGFGYLPKITGNHSHFPTMLRALDGGLDGIFLIGENPAVGSMHAGLMRRALATMKWVVVRDLQEIESATFWREGPEIRSGELKTEDIRTEVFLMPAAGHVEKEGSFTQTQRLVQWRDKALDPPGDARSDLWFIHHLFKRVKRHYQDSREPKDWPIQNMRWTYTEHGEHREPSAEDVLKEINGYDVATNEPHPGFAQLEADGSTACGCWIYSGVYAGGVNQARRRNPGDISRPGGWVSPEWGWAWPANRRMLYSRASADPDGKPWSERKKYVWWDGEKWTGYDVPDFPVDKPPDYKAPPDAKGMDAISGDDPFIMMADGRAWLFAPSGLLDGPLPTHYEPLESPLENPLYPDIHANPRGPQVDAPRQPLRGARRPALPLRRDHVSADRAPHRRRHVALGAVAGRAAAGDVRRDRPGARRVEGDRGRRLDDDLLAAGRDRRPRPRDRPHQAAQDRPSARAPGRAALALGLRRARSGRRRQRPDDALRRPEHVDPRVQGVRVRRPRWARVERHDEARRGARRAARRRPGQGPPRRGHRA